MFNRRELLILIFLGTGIMAATMLYQNKEPEPSMILVREAESVKRRQVVEFEDWTRRTFNKLGDAVLAVSRCGDVSVGQCKTALRGIEEQAAASLNELEKIRAPFCLGDVANEIGVALELLRSGASMGARSLETENSGQMVSALRILTDGTDTAKKAKAMLERSKCL